MKNSFFSKYKNIPNLYNEVIYFKQNIYQNDETNIKGL